MMSDPGLLREMSSSFEWGVFAHDCLTDTMRQAE
jgi:hypothetical protein